MTFCHILPIFGIGSWLPTTRSVWSVAAGRHWRRVYEVVTSEGNLVWFFDVRCGLDPIWHHLYIYIYIYIHTIVNFQDIHWNNFETRGISADRCCQLYISWQIDGGSSKDMAAMVAIFPTQMYRKMTIDYLTFSMFLWVVHIMFLQSDTSSHAVLHMLPRLISWCFTSVSYLFHLLATLLLRFSCGFSVFLHLSS